MPSRPPRPSEPFFSMGCVFKLVAFTLVAINVTWHGSIALFIGGPVGLVVYLVLVAVVWIAGWVTMRRLHEASEPPGPPPPDAAKEPDEAVKPSAA